MGHPPGMVSFLSFPRGSRHRVKGIAMIIVEPGSSVTQIREHFSARLMGSLKESPNLVMLSCSGKVFSPNGIDPKGASRCHPLTVL